MERINRENKDRLFRFLFGRPENKAWTLSLYNAVNGSHYTDPEAIELTTIDDILYMGMKNDVSFLVADQINLYEQQSTFNPNMPMRCLIYAGMLYSKYAEDRTRRINLYSTRQQRFPAPKLVCFYNGVTEQPDRTVLELKNAFPPEADADISVRVTMLNINRGRNRELLTSCRALGEYALFTDEIRRNQKETNDLEKAVDAALAALPEDSVILPFLLANKAEVKRMCLTEYDEAWTMELFREEALAEGMAKGVDKGRAEGQIQGALAAYRELGLSEADILRRLTERFGISEQDIRKYLS